VTSPFAQPSAGGDKFEPKEFGPGVLLLIYPKTYNGQATTKFGESTSADVDLIVVDRVDPETGGPFYFHNARLFGNLSNSVRDSIGGTVLGRLGQGPNTKGNPPWILNEYNDADAQIAGPIHQKYQAGLFKPKEQPQQAAQPPFGAPPQAPPAQDMWAGYNAAPAAPAPAAPAPAPAAPAGDPNIAFLIAKGVDPNQVLAMDVQNRALLAQSLK
jgi:hypothetical protein